MSETDFTSTLREHKRVEEMRKRDLPSYFPETHLDFSDYVFHREDVDIFMTVREYSSLAEVRLFFDHEDMANGVTLYSFSRETNWVTPFVYDNAWRDYLDNSSGEILRAEGKYSTEVVSESI